MSTGKTSLKYKLSLVSCTCFLGISWTHNSRSGSSFPPLTISRFAVGGSRFAEDLDATAFEITPESKPLISSGLCEIGFSFVYGVLATCAALACASGLGRLVVAPRSVWRIPDWDRSRGTGARPKPDGGGSEGNSGITEYLS